MTKNRYLRMGKNDKQELEKCSLQKGINQTDNPSVVYCCKCSGSCSDNHHIQKQTHLGAVSSSPALLTDCGTGNSHARSMAEKHIQAHNFISLPSPVQNKSFCDSIPDSVFLTPSLPTQSETRERPFSAPANYLEQISGQLLRLVGDHYLCSSCGRQLRNIGDQLTLETSLRKAISSAELNSTRNL